MNRPTVGFATPPKPKAERVIVLALSPRAAAAVRKAVAATGFGDEALRKTVTDEIDSQMALMP